MGMSVEDSWTEVERARDYFSLAWQQLSSAAPIIDVTDLSDSITQPQTASLSPI